ncbi:ABC-type multidrug transport system, permease component [Pyrinomonas methylaliphatogenes]|uniref:ABC-type multidrug transport system, permease component n=2 Tax=Pyrinomonas methylaliphatogenes TaxID=454194 RepID=A0A0B6WUC1_9BACT|nr:ABC-type multidrug transport system, permease component [Pyrinomonas methylaliphatogenes]
MRKTLQDFTNQRLWALFMKELQQIRRNRRLVISLIVPPTLLVFLFGFALNPQVRNLRLGVVDDSHTPESRELVSAFFESGVFQVESYYTSSDALSRALDAGDLDAGLIVPSNFAKRLARGEAVDVQLFVDAVDSNKATIAGGYASRIIAALSDRLTQASPLTVSIKRAQPPRARSAVPRVALFYNPGLRSDWFIIPGMLGVLLILNGSLVAAATMVREKEAGTVEQLLMTPAESLEIITAKIAPLFLLLSLDIWLVLSIGYFVFGIPVRGSLLLLFATGLLCTLAGIGIGTLIATFTKTQQQAQLMGFFVNPPLSLLSGAMTPVEAMPQWLRPLTNLNPVRHFAIIARSIMFKGVGFETLYPHIFALLGITLVLISFSVWRFRKQL